MANKVELYNNGTLIGTDNAPIVSSGNWSYSIPYTADSGNDVLTAKAFKDNVEVASSGVINVVVNAATSTTPEYVTYQTLTKTVATGNGGVAFDASTPSSGFGNGASGAKRVTGDNVISFDVPVTGTASLAGVGIAGSSYGGVSAAKSNMPIFVFANSGTNLLFIMENNVQIVSNVPYNHGGMEIRLIGTVMEVWADGVLVRTSPIAVPDTPYPVALLHGSNLNSAVLNVEWADNSNLVAR